MAHYVAVTGGRSFDDRRRVVEALELLQKFYGELRVMHGDAKGADRLAGAVAKEMGFVVKPYPADWSGPCDPATCGPGHRRSRDGESYCPAAGTRRNAYMVKLLGQWRDSGHSVSVLAFPGGAGTADMVERAAAADLAVSEM